MSMGMLQFLIGLAQGVEADDAFAELQAGADADETPEEDGAEDNTAGTGDSSDLSDVKISEEGRPSMPCFLESKVQHSNYCHSRFAPRCQ